MDLQSQAPGSWAMDWLDQKYAYALGSVGSAGINGMIPYALPVIRNLLLFGISTIYSRYTVELVCMWKPQDL